MDFKLRFIEGSSMVQLTVEAERYLTNNYDDIKWDIIDVFSYTPKADELYFSKLYGFVVHAASGDLFFCADIMFETMTDILVLGIKEIDLDAFLDFINNDQYIDYGI